MQYRSVLSPYATVLIAWLNGIGIQSIGKVLDSTVAFFDEKIFSWTQRTLQMAGLILYVFPPF